MEDPKFAEIYLESSTVHDSVAKYAASDWKSSSNVVGPSIEKNMLENRLEKTELFNSPFMILGASSRCDRKRIVELADVKSLELDHDVCQKARSELTNPRSRLAMELSWLPGVSPRKASQLVDSMRLDPMTVTNEVSIPSLARTNLIAAVLESIDFNGNVKELCEVVKEFSYLVDELDSTDIVKYINEDRAASGFPEVRTVDQVENELLDRKRHYRNVIKVALDELPTRTLIEVITGIVDDVTSGGEDHAPVLIDSLVDSYEVEAQDFLQKESENAARLIEAIRNSAEAGEGAIKPLVTQLDKVVRNWDMVAQPIQLSTKARGIDHQFSLNLAYDIRSLAIELFNKYDMLAQSQEIMALLQEVFSEVPDVYERIEQDADDLEKIFYEREESQSRKDTWDRDICFSADIGLLLKERLSISPEGISWKGRCIPLDSISRVRWGGVRNSVNGIPMGATYTIAFGDVDSESIVVMKNKDVYANFVEKLWMAVCVRIMGDMLHSLKKGLDLKFGQLVVHDNGLKLVKKKSFGNDEIKFFSWGEVKIWSGAGLFYIAAKDDRKFVGAISYLDVSNTHILEQIIRMAFKKPGLSLLSDLLN